MLLEGRIDYFAQYGFYTLVVWEHEMENLDQLKENLLAFDKKVVQTNPATEVT